MRRKKVSATCGTKVEEQSEEMRLLMDVCLWLEGKLHLGIFLSS